VKSALLLVLAVFGAAFLCVLVSGLRRGARGASLPSNRPWLPTWAQGAIGFVTVFFDTFGIGSFATTTAMFRAWQLVPDELIPGTLNVGHTLAAVLSAFIFIELVPVAPGTLLPMIAAAALGAWLGSGIVAHLPRYRIRLGMGMALLVAAGLLFVTQLGLLPAGSDALALAGPRLLLAVCANFLLGGLMTLGIGLYAPCMIVVSLLGMNPRASFPIMMGSCAMLMPISGARFVRKDRYRHSAAVGLTVGGIPALFIAAYLVGSLPIGAVRWVVIVVVLYTATTLLRAGRRELSSLRALRPEAPQGLAQG